MKAIRFLLSYVISFWALMSACCFGGSEVAQTVYREHLAKAPPGNHYKDDLLFVVVEIPGAARLNTNVVQAKCILQTTSLCTEMHKDYQFNQRGDKTDILLQRYPVLLEECREACPGFGLSDFRFRLPSRIVEDGTVGKVYRYVVAFPRKEFESQVSSLPQEDCSRTKTIACLKQRCDSLHSTGKDDEIIRLWLHLALLRKRFAKPIRQFAIVIR